MPRDPESRRTAGGWLPYRRPTGAATARLFCFPYAGGTARLFLPWADVLPDWLELCAIQLPGREERIREPLARRAADVAAELVTSTGGLLDLPFALFGHSMGGLLAYELTRALRRSGGPLPEALFVSATRPPHLCLSGPAKHLLSDRQLLAHLEEIGGTPTEFFEQQALWDVILPILRADLEICETYSTEGHGPLGIPISAFAGDHDRLAGRMDVARWQDYTTGELLLRTYPAGHFFIHQETASLISAVVQDLTERLSVRDSASRIQKEARACLKTTTHRLSTRY